MPSLRDLGRPGDRRRADGFAGGASSVHARSSCFVVGSRTTHSSWSPHARRRPKGMGLQVSRTVVRLVPRASPRRAIAPVGRMDVPFSRRRVSPRGMAVRAQNAGAVLPSCRMHARRRARYARRTLSSGGTFPWPDVDAQAGRSVRRRASLDAALAAHGSPCAHPASRFTFGTHAWPGHGSDRTGSG